MASNVPNWNEIKADFTGSNQLIKTAGDMWSQAGTVFGQMRKEILEQEQREIENAFREKALAEKARQFDLGYDLDVDKFKEANRQFDVTSKETATHHRNLEKYNSDSLALQERKFKHDLDVYEQGKKDTAALMDLLTGKTINEQKAKLAEQRQQVFTDNNATDADIASTASSLQQVEDQLAAQTAFINRQNNTPIVKNGITYANSWASPTEYNDALAQQRSLQAQRQYLLKERNRQATVRNTFNAANPEPSPIIDNTTRTMAALQAAGNPQLAATTFGELAKADIAAVNAAAQKEADAAAKAEQEQKKHEHAMSLERYKKENIDFNKTFRENNYDDSYVAPMASLANAFKKYAIANKLAVSGQEIVSTLESVMNTHEARDWSGVWDKKKEPDQYASTIAKAAQDITKSDESWVKEIMRRLQQLGSIDNFKVNNN